LLRYLPFRFGRSVELYVRQETLAMFKKKVQLQASLDSFVFSDRASTFEFRPKLFLDQEGLIVGVGPKPDRDGDFTEVDLFENETDKPHDFLAAALQFGLRNFSSRWMILPSHLEVSITSELAHALRGFETPIFERAGRDAGASVVNVSRLDI